LNLGPLADTFVSNWEPLEVEQGNGVIGAVFLIILFHFIISW
jgi:hypothetical protein